MPDPKDVERLARRLVADADPREVRALLEALMGAQFTSIDEMMGRDEAPTLLPVPAEVRGLRARLDLHGAKPPVWRRLELPGDLTLPRLHDVIQASMGWYDSHLHRFRTGRDPYSPYFVTRGDIEEGEDGTLEDDVRLDQLVAAKGDELWYEYDFGDGWDHRLVVEEVLAEAPGTVRCTGGRMACPPEDCGGLGGYEELAGWVRSGYDATQLPGVFEDAEDAHAWLPVDWDPDDFEIEEANAALAIVVAEPIAVTGELAALAEELERRGDWSLREVLAHPLSHGPTEVSDDEAARLTEPFRILLDLVGSGVTLTSAGYLPPAVVEQIAERSGITAWWIGKANREDLTPPVAQVRDLARALGLVSVRKGRLSPTAAAVRCQDAQALWRHIVSRLPLGTRDAERQAGWSALAVVGSGAPAEQWRTQISELMFALGWRCGDDRYAPPSASSPTLDALHLLAGATRSRWGETRGVDLAVAATARSAVHRR